MTTQPPPSPDTPADARACVRCGYSLVGFSETDGRRPCPECGLLSGLSFLDARDLKNNRPRWLRGLTRGAAVTAAGFAAVPAAFFGIGYLTMWDATRSFGGPAGYARVTGGRPLSTVLFGQVDGTPAEAALFGAMVFVPPSLVLLGLWPLTRPAGRSTIDRGTRGLRWPLRVLAFVPLGLCALTTTWQFSPSPPFQSQWSAVFVVLGLIALVGALPVLLFYHLRRLARIAPAPLLAADSPLVGWGVALLCLVPLPLIAAEALLDTRAGRPSPVADAVLIATGLLAAVGLTAYLWSIYLLVRYTLAFAKAARQAREVWAAGDLAGG